MFVADYDVTTGFKNPVEHFSYLIAFRVNGIVEIKNDLVVKKPEEEEQGCAKQLFLNDDYVRPA